jgi:hypothetical protein
MGIHMGPVVVGDIGTPNRINYTIVGDTVNATQRTRPALSGSWYCMEGSGRRRAGEPWQH